MSPPAVISVEDVKVEVGRLSPSKGTKWVLLCSVRMRSLFLFIRAFFPSHNVWHSMMSDIYCVHCLCLLRWCYDTSCDSFLSDTPGLCLLPQLSASSSDDFSHQKALNGPSSRKKWEACLQQLSIDTSEVGLNVRELSRSHTSCDSFLFLICWESRYFDT